MLQRWHEISFFHWSCDPGLIQGRLPSGLNVDTFEGRAWIGLTPFMLIGLRPPAFPRKLGLRFPEMNLRTYVIGPRGPGIWFFSLDAGRLSAVIGARLTYRLPYYWANMRVETREDQVSYFSSRGGRAEARIRVAREERIPEPSEMENFLTQRFRLYTLFGKRLIAAEVEHPPWQLNRIRVIDFEETVRRAARLEFPSKDFLAHHSAGVDTRIGRPMRAA